MEKDKSKSKVYYLNINKKHGISLVNRLGDAIDDLKMLSGMDNGDRVGIKLHFGERGGFSYIRPPFIGSIVERVKRNGGNPFLTDSNTLYHHKRDNAVDHLVTASINGFGYDTVGCPVIIADGLTGSDYETVEVGGNHLKEIYIASAVYNADFLIVASHFTAHPLACFGGAIKNLAMGGAAVKGKFQQHSEFVPGLDEDKCTLCGKCIEVCGFDAIRRGDKSIYFITENCVGCGECIGACRYGALGPKFPRESRKLQEKMVEYLMGIMKDKKGKIFFINFLLDVTPHCDCTDYSGAPIVSDLGILLSNDPVSLDLASVDLINNVPFNSGSGYDGKNGGGDKFRIVNKGTDWKWQIDYGVEMGIGSKEYEIVEH